MKSYGEYLSEIFPGLKVQKISIDAGFTCPNRDGSISTGGCIYCRNDSFSPSYCNPAESVKIQLQKGKEFFSKKYPGMKYLAYFQSYTGTYNRSISQLEKLYREALAEEDVVGLVVATRPDCIGDDVLNLLSELNKEKTVFIELGVETSHNLTLKVINRNHTWEDVEMSISKIAERGIHCGVHLILGLPYENEDMMLETIDLIVSLPVETLKLHQLQVLKGTILAERLSKGELEIPDFTLDDYLRLCSRIVKRIPDNMVIERFLSQSPPEMVISPSWGLKNYQFMAKLEKLL